jgi:hypothetical protein
MAHEKWGDNDDTATWITLGSLAWKIVGDSGGGLNPYPGAEVLQGNSDKDLWRDLTQGNARTEVWEHKGKGYAVVRSARVPYLVKDKKPKRLYVDHLLVGYAWPFEGEPTPGDAAWDPGNAGTAKQLKDLGEFLTVDVAPDSEKILRATSWQSSVDEDPTGTPTYTSSPKLWPFRRMDHTVEKSVRIPVVSEKGGSKRLLYLLVGYEGGGGW